MSLPTLEYLSGHDARVDWVRRIAAWLACFPALLLACLYGTWLLAWLAEGRRPIPLLDDPTSVNPAVTAFAWLTVFLLLAAWPAGLAYAALVGVLFFRRASRQAGTLAFYLAL